MANADEGRRPGEPRYVFDNGVRFECVRCGRCCTGAPGIIFVNRQDAERIAGHLGLALDTFLATHTRPWKDGHTLVEKANGECVFYEEGRCRIYEVRPTRCRTYPFWPETLRSEEAWRETCAECPGIGRGRIHLRDEILRLIHASWEAGPQSKAHQPPSD
ncbi:MAG: YkgJ family cysteine cluster protein [Kiritimatiellae bacterium]|nr:YkgJ family cysteine cluster protein [Kiritimatiellia bacterium]MDW8458158.1 YkgJ family cysteine cluster protein [Verrucomicrobiota bacterium]